MSGATRNPIANATLARGRADKKRWIDNSVTAPKAYEVELTICKGCKRTLHGIHTRVWGRWPQPEGHTLVGLGHAACAA